MQIQHKQHKNDSAARFLWERDLLIEINDKWWNNAYRKITKLTASTQLRYFQYQLIHRILITNIAVAKFSDDVTPMCTFCENCSETLMHLFIECTYVKRIRQLMKRCMKYFFVALI